MKAETAEATMDGPRRSTRPLAGVRPFVGRLAFLSTFVVVAIVVVVVIVIVSGCCRRRRH